MGAWIETARCHNRFYDVAVASHVGAWIETYKPHPSYSILNVASKWVSGLKGINVKKVSLAALS